MNRPLLFLSGVFYFGVELPKAVVDILWWNPLFHCIELVREGLIAGYDSPISDPVYVAFWAFSLLFGALTCERYMIRSIRL